MRGLIWEKECTSNSTVTADGFHSARWCRWKQFGKLCGTNLLRYETAEVSQFFTDQYSTVYTDFTGEEVLPLLKTPKVPVIWPRFTLTACQVCSLSISKKSVISGLVFWEVWHQPLSCMINVWATATENSATANGMLNNRWNRRNLLICDQYYLTLGPPKTQIWSGFAPHSSEGKYNWTDIFMSYCSHKMDKNL